MTNFIHEKRHFPRINAEIPLQITPEFLGATVDLSETGFKFILQKPFLLSTAKAKIQVSNSESINTEFRLVWNKNLLREGKFTYGACFIRLKEKDLDILRQALIETQLNGFINSIDNPSTKESVKEYFLKDVKRYIAETNRLAADFDTKKIDKEASPSLKKISDEIVRKGEEIIKKISSKAIIKKIKISFRLLIGPWAYKSLIMKRGFDKPRGYPGDYRMLELIYDEKPISSGFGKHFDSYFLNNPYAEAVRRRKDKTAELLLKAINEHKGPTMNILNLASGSCREIKDMLSSQKLTYKGKLNFGLLDRDEEALSFSEQMLNVFKQDNVKFSYLKENILKLYGNNNHFQKLFGKQDLIYSIGLIDYFPDRMLKEMILFCLDLLTDDGKLILTIKDIDKDPFAPLPPGWFCDWEFVPRNEKDIINLLNSLKRNISIKNETDKSGKIVFLEITKS